MRPSICTTPSSADKRQGFVVMMSINDFNLFLTLAEIMAFAIARLNPVVYLISQTVKTTVWFVLSTISVTNVSKWQTNGGVGDDIFFRLIETLVSL